MKLGQLDQAITSREGEIMESRKNMELIKMRMPGESYEAKALRMSQSSLGPPNRPIPRGKSYSSIKLQQVGGNGGEGTVNKLRSRGYSLSKLKVV